MFVNKFIEMEHYQSHFKKIHRALCKRFNDFVGKFSE